MDTLRGRETVKVELVIQFTDELPHPGGGPVDESRPNLAKQHASAEGLVARIAQFIASENDRDGFSVPEATVTWVSPNDNRTQDGCVSREDVHRVLYFEYGGAKRYLYNTQPR